MGQRKGRIVKIKISAMPLILILRWSEVLATGFMQKKFLVHLNFYAHG